MLEEVLSIFLDKNNILKYFVKHIILGQVGRVFANGPGDLGSIPGHVILKTLRGVLVE